MDSARTNTPALRVASEVARSALDRTRVHRQSKTDKLKQGKTPRPRALNQGQLGPQGQINVLEDQEIEHYPFPPRIASWLF